MHRRVTSNGNNKFPDSTRTIHADLGTYTAGFTVHGLANATAHLLGPDWSSGPHNRGARASLTGPYETSFLFRMDDDETLAVELSAADQFPAKPDLPDGAKPLRSGPSGMWFKDPEPDDGIDALAARCAAAIRAIIGYTPAPVAETRYVSTPGTEFPFSVSDIARATAHILGERLGGSAVPSRKVNSHVIVGDPPRQRPRAHAMNVVPVRVSTCFQKKPNRPTFASRTEHRPSQRRIAMTVHDIDRRTRGQQDFDGRGHLRLRSKTQRSPTLGIDSPGSAPSVNSTLRPSTSPPPAA
ncbi:hypothetical protein [Streptomyces misionensis]|uniref:hypothetical protein n=1 Tax=Streptomyces misionensis TaxID=67331 RepID=UPI003F4CC5AE